MITGPLGLISLILFIIFWVRIAGYSKKLAGLPYDYEGTHEDRYDGLRGPSSDAIRPADPGAHGDSGLPLCPAGGVLRESQPRGGDHHRLYTPEFVDALDRFLDTLPAR